MKLNINLDLLDSAIKKMGAQSISFTPKKTILDPIDKVLGSTSGKKININDIEINLDGGGLFEYEGRQVLLFIPNQFNQLAEILHNPIKGNRFHVADCSTLQEMKQKNKYNKYHVTHNLSEKFEIYNYRNEDIKKDAKLHVCKNCLEKLNYKNYKNESYNQKQQIFENFDIGEFFERYSTLFDYVPTLGLENNQKNNQYTNDWKSISQDYRAKKYYICETCDTSFNKNKQLLHTHHINGIKNDNNPNNLKAVCIDCHRKEPNHRHVYITYDQLQQIYILRREQNKVNIENWDDVFKYSDLSMHGYIDLLRVDGKMSIPDVGYIIEINNKKIALDLVWQNTYKKSAVATEYSYNFFMLKDWNILSLGDALLKYTQKKTQNIQEENIQIKQTAQSAIELQSMINYTTQIETILENMGARARGLHGKVTKVEKKLSKDIIFKLRRIASIRNKKMHQANYYNYIFKDFEDDCKIVISYLKKLENFNK